MILSMYPRPPHTEPSLRTTATDAPATRPRACATLTPSTTSRVWATPDVGRRGMMDPALADLSLVVGLLTDTLTAPVPGEKRKISSAAVSPLGKPASRELGVLLGRRGREMDRARGLIILLAISAVLD